MFVLLLKDFLLSDEIRNGEAERVLDAFYGGRCVHDDFVRALPCFQSICLFGNTWHMDHFKVHDSF